jgi:hypothetical protein
MKRLFNGIVGHYSYDESYLTKLIEDEKKEQNMKTLIEISDKLIEQNPNYIDEVKKSETGCWMDQMYGTHKCTICDFVDDCPTKLEYDWQAYLAELTPEQRIALEAAMPQAKESK